MPTGVGEENGDRTPIRSLKYSLLDTEVGMGSSEINSNSLLCGNAPPLEDRGGRRTGYGSIDGGTTGRVKDDTVGEVDDESIPAGADGIKGLLAIPHIPTLLFLTAIKSVRCGKDSTRQFVRCRRMRV